MRIPWKLLTVALPVSVLVACSEQPSSPNPSAVASSGPIAADYTNNPYGGGPWIWRGTFHSWAIFFDSDDGLVRAWFTTFPLDGYLWAPWDNTLCGPPGMGTVHFQEISHWDPTHMDPTALYIENMNADGWIVLTSLAPGATGPCAGEPIIASGPGTMRYNDNNMTGLGATHESASVKLHGNLTMPSGDAVRFNGHLHCEFNAGAKADFSCNSQINF